MSAPETVATPAPVEEVKPTEAPAAEPTPAPAAEEPKVEATVSTRLIDVSFFSQFSTGGSQGGG